MNSNSLKIEIQVDDKGTVKVRQLGSEVEKTGKKGKSSFSGMKKSLGDFNARAAETHSSLLKLAGGIAGILALGRAIDFLHEKMVYAVTAASDLAEVQGKFDVVFDGQTEKAEGWAQALVDSYAMSRREAKQYLSSVQDLLVPMGMAATKAGVMSNEIVKLSADLGSFNNLPTSQVMDDIQSALVGNYETMKKYGVVLNASTVEQKALAMGLADTKDKLDAADKAQAAYALMVAGSQAAIGDMARTSAGYANQMKQFDANIENIAAAIGGKLLPLLAQGLSEVNNYLKKNEQQIVSLAQVGIVKVVTGIEYAIKVMRFFHNAWSGIKLVGSAAVHAIAIGLETIFNGLRTINKPLDLIFDGLVKLDMIKVNPFDTVAQGLEDFKASSGDVTQQVWTDIENTNKSYDSIIARVDGWKQKIAEIPAATAEATDKTKLINQEAALAVQEAAAAQLQADKEAADQKQALIKKYSDEYMTAKYGEYEFGKMMLDQRKEEMMLAFEDEAVVMQALAEKYRELEVQKAQDSNNFFEGLRAGWQQASVDMGTWGANGFSTMQGFVSSSQDALSNSLFKFMTGELKSLKDVWKATWAAITKYVLEQIAKMIAKMLILKALQAATGIGALFHDGGPITAHTGMYIHPALSNPAFINAQYAHSGKYLKSDEVPIIAQTGEFILSRQDVRNFGGPENIERMRRGGSAASQQVVYNPQFTFVNQGVVETDNIDEWYAKRQQNAQNYDIGMNINTTKTQYAGL